MKLSKTDIEKFKLPDIHTFFKTMGYEDRIISPFYVSGKKKFFWAKIPKAAGTSIRNALQDFGANRATAWENIPDLEGYYKFTVVRNPWDRMVSLYHNFHPWEIPEEYSFTDFIKRDYSKDSPKLRFHRYPQYLYMIWTEFDNVFRVENLKSDWKLIKKRLKIDAGKLERKNATQHDHYSKYYTDETREIIAKDYWADIRMFSYKFEENI